MGVGSIQPTWDASNGNGYYITQGFNTSCDPSADQGYYMYGLYYCGHTGVDLATATASPVIHCVANGIVVVAGYNGSYGVMARIRHFMPDGSVMYSQYEHMQYGSLAVYAGEIVSQGQELGLVGATGFATGPHLHFEIKSVDEDGYGYTFGNSALIQGYVDGLQFVAAHQLEPATFIFTSGRTIVTSSVESDPILQQFLQSYKHFVVVAVSDGLHVRVGPGLDSSIIGTALRGAKLGYIQTQGAWIEVALPQNVRGWVNKSYVTGYQDWDVLAAQASAKSWPPAGASVASVNALGLNVRSGPAQSYSILAAVYQHDKVVILSDSKDWAHVKTRDGTSGWVMRMYIDEPGVAAAPKPLFIVPTVSVLRVRSGPGLQYSVSGSVFGGTPMQFVRDTPNWVSVILPDGTTGWVAKPLTEWQSKTAAKAPAHPTSPSQPQSSVLQQPKFVKVTASILNIRSGPSVDHPVIAEVRQDTTLQVLSFTAHWVHVALPASNIDGWVVRTFTQ